MPHLCSEEVPTIASRNYFLSVYFVAIFLNGRFHRGSILNFWKILAFKIHYDCYIVILSINSEFNQGRASKIRRALEECF